MADALTVNFKGLEELKQKLSTLKAGLVTQVDYVLDKGAQAIATKARQNTPVDEGILRNSIGVSVELSDRLTRRITVNAPYAAFVEFGTGRFAAEQVSKLPQEWQDFASQFRGQKGSGSFYDFVIIIKEWLRRHPEVLQPQIQYHPESGNVIHTKKKRQSRDEKEAELDRAAYFIARKIYLNGVKAQPYLWPAFRDSLPEIIASFNKLFE